MAVKEVGETQQWLSVAQAADYLGVSLRGMRYALKLRKNNQANKELQIKTFGKRILVQRNSLETIEHIESYINQAARFWDYVYLTTYPESFPLFRLSGPPFVPPMNIEVRIKSSKERMRLILKVKKILENAGYKTQIVVPDKEHCDIGLNSDPVSKEILARVISQIERNGYTINTDGPA